MPQAAAHRQAIFQSSRTFPSRTGRSKLRAEAHVLHHRVAPRRAALPSVGFDFVRPSGSAHGGDADHYASRSSRRNPQRDSNSARKAVPPACTTHRSRARPSPSSAPADSRRWDNFPRLALLTNHPAGSCSPRASPWPAPCKSPSSAHPHAPAVAAHVALRALRA